MREAFRRHPNVEVLDIDNLVTASYPLWRIKQAAYWFALGKRYWMNREPAVLDGYAAQVAAKAKAVRRGKDVDMVCSPVFERKVLG